MHPLRASLAVSLLLVAASTSFAAPITEEPRYKELDKGKFVIRVKDKVIGAEEFGIEARSDSINCLAKSSRTRTTDQGEEEIQKFAGMSFGRLDWDLRMYRSEETFRGQTLVRGVTIDPRDTVFTVYRERKDGAGEAMRYATAPGRMFVMDSGVYTLFDVLCLHLHGQTFQSRPVNILTFGARDTVMEAQVVDLGRETIRWGARPMQARKLQVSQGPLSFELWVDPQGRMIRLAHAPTGLMVEREAPPIKKRGATAPKPGG
jgi:hypothetical protein